MAENGNWQDTGRETKLWILNSSTSFPILLFLLNLSWGTFFVVIVTMGVFGVLDYYGFKPMVFLRRVRVLLAGPRKSARPWWMS
ncbi:IcmT/TraK family protein [Candidatus Synchoanobacter obligatus]|uniref:IcmT/TraK family protein n=1 Tax=Candidatus Synchoanobacter obligatus TaxID=2919597 RepID=A0ABT1L6M1_9GAMM|nr:IcmT/TraK family protein [Candidatus Synchoanobacter obligatus]MCP8352365.1 IcmT/TraK family protein [Candidatus Synchoanobacter obligatus]